MNTVISFACRYAIVRKPQFQDFLLAVSRVLESHLQSGSADNVLIYGVVRTLADIIIGVVLSQFGDRLNHVSYWGATKQDIGGPAQCVRPDSPTVMLVTAAAATGINLDDVGVVIAFKVQDVCELQQIAGRANRDGTRVRVPVLVCVDEATLRMPTVSASFRRTLSSLRRTGGCVARHLLSDMVPPTVRTATRCGGCTSCDSGYRDIVSKWFAPAEGENVLSPDADADIPDVESPILSHVLAVESDSGSDDDRYDSEDVDRSIGVELNGTHPATAHDASDRLPC